MAWADLMICYPSDSFMADIDLECLTTLEARMFKDSEGAGPQASSNGVWMLVNITGSGMCISTFLTNGLWNEITAILRLK
jgi:hypothetical protein